MKVYIVINEWRDSDNNCHDIKKVFDSELKAQAYLTELYHDDVKWLNDKGITTDQFDENTLEPSYYAVSYDENFSETYISEETVL